MTQENASKLIEQSLPAIYGYAFSKLYDKSQAEDLSQEIVLEIIRSAENLKNDKAFWGFAWKIAENTFRKYIKRRELIAQSISLEAENLMNFLPSDDDEIEKNDLIYKLRRELSMLSKTHREVCVSYYVKNTTCSEIAKEQKISVEMVKQHLFKARKLLKEGMEMERKLGEKSYNPGVFRLNFWGDWNNYGNTFNKKLPGAILLAAYNNSLTAEELSMEIGVAMPYLEEEMEILEAAGLLIKRGKKYETNIVIITEEYDKELERQSVGMYVEIAEKIFNLVKDNLTKIRELDFHGNDYDDNRLLFGIINIALIRGYEWSGYISPRGDAPKLPLGSHGWVFGHDNNFENLHFKAVTIRSTNKEGSAWFSAENYRVMLSAQHFMHRNFNAKIEAMCDAILEREADVRNEALPELIEDGIINSKDGRLSARFPVFDNAVFEQLLEILKPIYEDVAKCMIDASDKAGEMLAKTVPTWLIPQCKDIAAIQYRLNVAAYIMEHLVENERLTVPNKKTPITVFGVKK